MVRRFASVRSLFLIAVPLAAAFAQDIQCPIEKQVDLTIQTSAFPSLPGQSLRITAFIGGLVSIPDPTGTIQLFDGSTDLGTFPIMLGQVSATVTFFQAGSHILSAYYSGDMNYCSANVNFGQAVDRLLPTVTLTVDAASAAFGAPVVLTAQIAPPAPAGVAPPSGPVQFFDGSAPLGSSLIVAGKAQLTVSNLSSGTHQISATLIGDPNWYSVRSTTIPVSINQTATVTTLTGSTTASQVTLTANVAAAGSSTAAPSGSVQFVDTTSNTVLGTATLPANSITLPLAQIAASIGHPIAAVYSGSASFGASSSTPLGVPGILNATGAQSSNFAPDEIVSLFSFNLAAAATPQTAAPPLPTTLGGASVTVTDSAGVARQAPLYLVSAQQINFVVPAATAPGAATIAVAGAPAIPLRVNIAPVAPGIFTSAVQVLRVAADGSQTTETVIPTTPIRVGPGATYLILYGTGIRNRSSLDAATLSAGTLKLPVAYAGPQSQFPGLDQVDVLLPASLQSAGKVNVNLVVDSQASNVLSLTFQ